MPFLTHIIDPQVLVEQAWLTGLPEEGSAGIAVFQHFKAKADAVPGDSEVARNALRLVAAASILSLNASNRSRPFSVLMQADDMRSAALEDFGLEDAQSLALIAESTNIPALRARLADVAWEAGRIRHIRLWQSGVTAASAYYQVASAQLGLDDLRDGREALARGMELAWQFRAQVPEITDDLWRLAEESARSLGGGERPGLLIFLADLCSDRKRELAPTFAPILEQAANAHFATYGPTLFHAELWGRASKLWNIAGDVARSNAARASEGEGYVAHAEDGAANPLFASHWMKVGLATLRRASAEPARIDAVHHRVLQLQQEATDQLTEHSVPIDVREMHELVMGLVSGKTLDAALFGLARVDVLLNPATVRQAVIDEARRSPILGFMTQDLMNEQGATVARRAAILGVGADEQEEAIRLAMYHHAKSLELKIRGEVIALRAARAIQMEHRPSEHDIARFVVGHPFVPPQIAVSVLRGLQRGFDGDWLSAGTYLIPRMEWLVRHWFKRRGQITSTVLEGGIQEERSLSQLLDLPSALDVLGEQLLFELRCHLTEPWGFNLRHSLAHGLIPDAEFDSAGTVSLWWLVWRIMLTPLINAAEQDTTPPEEAAAAATPAEE